MNPEAWASARRVLAVRLDAAGDVLMTSPALRALAEGGPAGTEVTLLTSPAGAAIARLIPELSAVVYEAPWMKASAPLDPAAHLAMIERLRAARYDAAVIFTVYSQSALPAAQLCLLAGIPLRLAHARENPYQLLTDWVPETEPHAVVRHETQRQLDLVVTVGRRPLDERLRLAVPEDARRWAARFIAEQRLEDVPWCVLHVGASAPSRRYPPELFAEAARTLAARHGWRLAFTGSDDERPLVETVRGLAAVDSVSLCGQLDLSRLAALIEAAPLLISNNTLPAHIAAAVQTPVVDLYALTNPQHTPWRVPSRVLSHDVPCRDCYKSICPLGHQLCLAGVPPADVVAAALDLAGAASTRPAVGC